MNTVPSDEIERALCQLKGVEAARVCWKDGAIEEVHVAAAAGTRPKHIARDVRSYLAAARGIEVDHKKISIAMRKAGDDHHGNEVRATAQDGRARLGSLSLRIEATGAEVEVRLSVNGRVLQGCAKGAPTGAGLAQLAMAATLDALQPLLRADVRLVAAGLRRVRMGAREARLVQVTVWQPQQEQSLLGVCWVRDDPYRAVVLATLDALNRPLCRLAPVHWTEIRVEPGGSDDDGEDAG